MTEDSQHSTISRRSFGRGALLAAASVVSMSGTEAPAQETGESFQHTRGLSEEAVGRARSRYQNILREYGSRLSEEQKKHVRAILVENERMLAPILSFPLENGDPPSDVLKFPETEKPGATDAQ